MPGFFENMRLNYQRERALAKRARQGEQLHQEFIKYQQKNKVPNAGPEVPEMQQLTFRGRIMPQHLEGMGERHSNANRATPLPSGTGLGGFFGRLFSRRLTESQRAAQNQNIKHMDVLSAPLSDREEARMHELHDKTRNAYVPPTPEWTKTANRYYEMGAPILQDHPAHNQHYTYAETNKLFKGFFGEGPTADKMSDIISRFHPDAMNATPDDVENWPANERNLFGRRLLGEISHVMLRGDEAEKKAFIADPETKLNAIARNHMTRNSAYNQARLDTPHSINLTYNYSQTQDPNADLTNPHAREYYDEMKDFEKNGEAYIANKIFAMNPFGDSDESRLAFNAIQTLAKTRHGEQFRFRADEFLDFKQQGIQLQPGEKMWEKTLDAQFDEFLTFAAQRDTPSADADAKRHGLSRKSNEYIAMQTKAEQSWDRRQSTYLDSDGYYQEYHTDYANWRYSQPLSDEFMESAEIAAQERNAAAPQAQVGIVNAALNTLAPAPQPTNQAPAASNNGPEPIDLEDLADEANCWMPHPVISKSEIYVSKPESSRTLKDVLGPAPKGKGK